MKVLELFLLALMIPGYSWGCGTSSLSSTNITLPAQILLKAGMYASGTVLYDSGEKRSTKGHIQDCKGDVTGHLTWSSGATTSGIITTGGSDHIYQTSVPNIGIQLSVTPNIVWTNGGSDKSVDVTAYVESTSFSLGKTNDGILDFADNVDFTPSYRLKLISLGGQVPSNSSLRFSGTLATLKINDSRSSSQSSAINVNMSGDTTLQLTPMGCTASTSSLKFDMGHNSISHFKSYGNAISGTGGAQKMTLACEPGTNVTISLNATPASGYNHNNDVIALTQEEGVATGVGVQLVLSHVGILHLNTPQQVFLSQRTFATPDGEGAAPYQIFGAPNNPGGALASNELTFTAQYFQTAETVTAGKANASGILTFTYN